MFWDYPFESMNVNGREVSLQHIVSGNAAPVDDFEQHTFDFVQRWLNGESEFTIHTSGSTGKPKPITLRREQMESSARATLQALQLRKGDQGLICLDAQYIAGKMMLVRCLVGGLRIRAVTPSANPLHTLDWGIVVHFAAFVPYQVNAILKSEDAPKLNSVKTIIVGGAPFPTDTEELLSGYACQVFVTYGMTETISHVAMRRVGSTETARYYRALPDISFDIDDRSCLIIACPYISDKVVTNDVVRLVNPTTFEWIGRIDNVINTGGVKVLSEAIEKEAEPVIKRLNLHGRLLVLGIPDADLGEKVILVIEVETLETALKHQILDSLRSRLPKFYVPRDVVSLAEFPLTESGKIDRVRIKKLISKQL